MNEDRKRELLMKAVDGLASGKELEELKGYTQSDPALANEFTAFCTIKAVTDSIMFKELPDSYWAGYWTNIYRKIERKSGWVFLSIGAIIVFIYCAYLAMQDFWVSDSPLIVKIGAGSAGTGVIILLVSATREMLFARKKERYKEVER